MDQTPVSTLSALNLVECSHHDLGWHKCAYDAEADFTFQEINTALDMMQLDPTFTWTHECCSFLYAYLEHFPNRREELARRIAEGRFDVGAGYTMPYTSFVTSEMLVRQFIYGKKWVEDTFPGFESRVYYNTDVPGLGTQMPQIMKKAGVPYLYASRSWNFDGFKGNEFRQMKAPDQSSVKVFFMNHYTNMYFGDPSGKPYENKELMLDKIRDYEDDRAKKQVGPALPMLLETDCMMPSNQQPSIQAWNAYAAENGLPQLRYSTMKDALDAVFCENADLEQDQLSGEWPSKWFYENAASDHETFLMQREAERFLRSAETLYVIRAIATGSFEAYPSKQLEEAWRACDHACHGYAPEQCIIDFKKVYGKAISMARTLYEDGFRWLVSAVKTDPARGIPVVVYNNLSWPRTDVVSMEKPTGKFCVTDADGKEIPCQIGEGKLIFVAGQVPALGYRTYYLKTGEASGAASFQVGQEWTQSFSNSFYRVTPVADGGALEEIIDLENGSKSLFSTEKFKIAELYDFQYDGMGAGEQLNMWQPHHGVSQLGYFSRWICTESGPVRTVFETSAPAAARGPATLRLTVYNAIKRLDFDMKLDLDAAGSRQLRLMFPVQAGDLFGADGCIDHSRTAVSYEVPFGSVTVGDEMLPKFSSFNDNTGDPNNVGGGRSKPEDFTDNNAVRPREVQNWVEASDSDRDCSVAISSYNLGWDYQDATAHPVRTPVLQPVLVSTSKACHWLYGKWLQPGTHCFHFSLTSGSRHNSTGRRMLVGVNNPLAAAIQTVPGSTLPESRSGISVSQDHICVTAVKKAEDSQNQIVVRYYETEGTTDSWAVTLSLGGAHITQAREVNLIERPTRSNWMAAENGSLTGPVAPWSIETAMVSIQEIK